MAEILQIEKDGIKYYPVTVPEAIVDSSENSLKSVLDSKRDKLTIQNITSTTLTESLQPNTIYNCLDPLTSIDITLINSSDSYNEYVVFFKGITDMPVSLPDSVYWANGEIPIIESDVEYELNIATRIIEAQTFYKAILVPFKTIV